MLVLLLLETFFREACLWGGLLAVVHVRVQGRGLCISLSLRTLRSPGGDVSESVSEGLPASQLVVVVLEPALEPGLEPALGPGL